MIMAKGTGTVVTLSLQARQGKGRGQSVRISSHLSVFGGLPCPGSPPLDLSLREALP
eukprot:COSAG04_NODE_476_length_13722_cov_16.614707_11_plen_57_part_00